jgi:chemosensory pili system protein ChpA (sensor histidine kinase/response regulator)
MMLQTVGLSTIVGEEILMAAPYAMVIEDDPRVAELFQRALQDAGYQAEIMENGHKAQARLVFTTPDLIVLDMHLPSLEGTVLLRQIRGQQRFKNVHIVVATGDQHAAASYAEQVDHVLLKPIGYEQLRSIAENYLSVEV